MEVYQDSTLGCKGSGIRGPFRAHCQSPFNEGVFALRISMVANGADISGDIWSVGFYSVVRSWFYLVLELEAYVTAAVEIHDLCILTLLQGSWQMQCLKNCCMPVLSGPL